MATYPIADIEDAVIAALAGLKAQLGDDPPGLGVRSLKSYGGELEVADVKKITPACPAIYVIYGDSDYAANGPRKAEKMTLELLICDSSALSEEVARRGSTRNPGTYRMLAACRDLLVGQSLGLADLTPLQIVADTRIWNGNGLSIYSQRYETGQKHLYPL